MLVVSVDTLGDAGVAHLTRLGQPFTSLRNGSYTSSLQFHIADAAMTGELAAPVAGPVTWTARDDLAQAAAAILDEPGRFEGPTPPLVAADAVDLREVAALLCEPSGRTVRRVVVEDDDFVAGLVARGPPEPYARIFLGSSEAMRRGEFAVTDPALATLLGRAPQSVRDALPAALST